MLRLNFFVAVILSATTPYVLSRLCKYNPKELMISDYLLTGIIAVAVAVSFSIGTEALG
ncbi:hypothetical protein N8550_03015 [Pirellulaceae bacterium]|jgi:hypothetical protein|nr:hypothetical protein [Pirellulaceae bacterium]